MIASTLKLGTVALLCAVSWASASQMTLYPNRSVAVKGTISEQDISVLSLKEQSGYQNDWETYVELSASAQNKVAVKFFFALDAQAQTCTSATLVLNTLGESRDFEKWNFRMRNFAENRFVRVAINGYQDWSWEEPISSSVEAAPYTHTNGYMMAKVDCANCSVMDIDYMALSLTGCAEADSSTVPPVAVPPLAAVASYNIQYSSPLVADYPLFDVLDVDTDEVTAAQIATYHAAGKTVMCYMSAGSYEDWRSDAGVFPATVLGNDMAGWPGERWLDISQIGLLRPIMHNRMAAAAAKGCDAIDPDNIDGYSNNTGFALSYLDQIAYNSMLADEAHALGLKIALKNDVEQIADLVGAFDYAVNESCYAYSECGGYAAFADAGKPVFIIEYNRTRFQNSCSDAALNGWFMIHKNLSLDSFYELCP